VLSVGDGITNHILQEDLEDTSGLLAYKTTETLDATTPSQTTDRRLGDTLDVITKNLTMPLGATLSLSLTSHSSP
jgi:hypothetical protein